MSHLNFLYERFHVAKKEGAIVVDQSILTYGELLTLIEYFKKWLSINKVAGSMVVELHADYSHNSIALLLALIELKCIIIPLTHQGMLSAKDIIESVAADVRINLNEDDLDIHFLVSQKKPALYGQLFKKELPGLVMFTSGSTGAPKAVVHDFSKLLQKFHQKRSTLITLNFLLFDHWGGLNTLFNSLSNTSLVVIPDKRTPESIVKTIEKYKVELLPTTPSFLGLMILSKVFSKADISSLKLITYGAEPMPEKTLQNLRLALPSVELRQTYGMIELGVLRAKSRSQDSLWLKIGGEGYETRVMDNILQIKADSAMLGYIGQESPFTEDGYLITGDLVEVDGDWMRILGRSSDIINVGGNKVYPAEVESTLIECPCVQDAMVYREENPILGQIVCASIVLAKNVIESEASKAIRLFCRSQLQEFMIPQKIKFVNVLPISHRLKRIRPQIK